MLTWWIILLCDLLVPAIMMIGGIIMKKHCPKDINGLLGYRTTRSMKNMDTWKFAHEYCGKLWQKVGAISFAVSALAHLPFYHSEESTLEAVSLILMAIQLIVIIAPIFATEKALKETFNEDGTRK